MAGEFHFLSYGQLEDLTSCFVYSDLAHKLAGVCGNVFKLLAKNDERSPVRDGVTSGVASSVATERA